MTVQVPPPVQNSEFDQTWINWLYELYKRDADVSAVESDVDAAQADATQALADAAAAQSDATQAIADAATAQATADGKIVTFLQASFPVTSVVGAVAGDLWLDSDDNNNMYRHNGGSSDTSADWDDVADGNIATALANAASAQSTADGKITTFYAADASPPTAEGVGDLWYVTDEKVVRRWNGSNWSSQDFATLGATWDSDITNQPDQYVYKNNLVDSSVWLAGMSMPPTDWTYYGALAENEIVYAIGPKGANIPVWECISDTIGSGAGGFVNHPEHDVDINKTYRYAIPVRRTTSDTNGTVYFGIGQSDVCDLNTTTVDTNPYFVVASRSALTQNKWYLLVGYVYPYNTTGLTHDGAACYDMETGEAITVTTTDNFNWNTGITSTSMRAFQFDVTTSGGKIQLASPMIHVVDGSEPSLNELLNSSAIYNSSQSWTDISGSGKPDDNADVTLDNTAGQGVNVANYKFTVLEDVRPADTEFYRVNTNLSYTTSAGFQVYGSYGTQITSTVASPSVSELGFTSGTSDYNMRISGNKKWIVSAYMRASGVSHDVGFKITTPSGSYTTSYQTVTTGSFNRYTYVIDLSADGNETAYLSFLSDSPTSATVWLDGLMVEQQIGNQTTASSFTLPSAEINELAFLDSVDNDTIADNTQITDAGISTSTTGQRIVVNETTNELEFYDSTNTLLCTIGINTGQSTDQTVVLMDGQYQCIDARTSGNRSTIYAINTGGNTAVYGRCDSSNGEGGWFSTLTNNAASVGLKAQATTLNGLPFRIMPSSSNTKPSPVSTYEGAMWVPLDGNSMWAVINGSWRELLHDNSTITQTQIGASAIGTGELNDTTGIQSVSVSTGTTNYIEANSSNYKLDWEIRASTSNRLTYDGITGGVLTLGTSYNDYYHKFTSTINSATAYVRTRYVDASPPYDLGDGEIPLFIYAVVDSNGQVVATSIDKNPPWARMKKPYKHTAEGDIRTIKDMSGFNMTRKEAASAGKLREYMQYFRQAKDVQEKVTTEDKNTYIADKPHPFGRAIEMNGFDVDHTIVMLNPFSEPMLDLYAMHTDYNDDEGSFDIAEMLHENYFIVDNTDSGIKGPPGILVPNFRWKNTS